MFKFSSIVPQHSEEKLKISLSQPPIVKNPNFSQAIFSNVFPRLKVEDQAGHFLTY